MRGLAMFRHRSLYANVINDRAVPFYTGFACSADPFVDLSTVDIHYIPGYEDVILDTKRFVTRKTKQLTRYEALAYNARELVTKLPFYLLIGLIGIPIGSTFLLVNAGIQSYYSAQRIKLHESGKTGIGIAAYRLPLLVKNVQKSAARAMEGVAHTVEPSGAPFLTDRSTTLGSSNLRDDSDGSQHSISSVSHSGEEEKQAEHEEDTKSTEETTSTPTPLPNTSDFPTLSLTPEQFEMIENINAAGFEKYAVHIHKAPHSHAAIIVRTKREAFGEGKVVLKHWAERFEV